MTNNFSESFNNAINKFINMNHPKISIYVEKIKNYIKMKISDYYENSKKIKEKTNNEEISKKEFIFEKIKKFINKYQLLYENDVQLSQIKVLYDKNKIEIYEIMIYLWVDIINDEEDEEFMNIYNN